MSKTTKGTKPGVKSLEECTREELETVMELMQIALEDETSTWRHVWREQGLDGFLPEKPQTDSRPFASIRG